MQPAAAVPFLVDSVCPLLRSPDYVDSYQTGGFSVVTPTCGGLDRAGQTLRSLGRWHAVLRKRPDLHLVSSAQDFEIVEATGKTGVVLHFQGSEPVEDSMDLLDVWAALGVKILQLTYSGQTLMGQGSEERSDAGLSHFGQSVIRQLNALGVAVDCAHAGRRTTLDAIDSSAAPVIISHAGCASVHQNSRNVTDEIIAAIAANGGLIGTTAFPGFVSPRPEPTIDDFLDHMVHMASVAGPQAICLGLDYYIGQRPYTPDATAVIVYEARVTSGAWTRSTHPAPPYIYPGGIETPDRIAVLFPAMRRRGFSDTEIAAICGENYRRVLSAIWGDPIRERPEKL